MNDDPTADLRCLEAFGKFTKEELAEIEHGLETASAEVMYRSHAMNQRLLKILGDVTLIRGLNDDGPAEARPSSAEGRLA